MGESVEGPPASGNPAAVEGTHSWHWVEDIVIVLVLLTLWPTILGWSGMLYRLLEIAALGVLVGILVRRIGRFRSEKKRMRPN
ncbi:MAG: hypothetical protein KAJ05_03485 [Candidatus Latescibacteria bacterium]|nr:hypothetical protein [Candidatus Latescibacterota bacterium]MCK5734369.1 hypothetical protein [Candidatus Latescibacterota bacterium]